MATNKRLQKVANTPQSPPGARSGGRKITDPHEEPLSPVDSQADPASEKGKEVVISEEQLAQVRRKLELAETVNRKLHGALIHERARARALEQRIQERRGRLQTHSLQEYHRKEQIDRTRAQHAQAQRDQHAETFSLSKQVMTLDERVEQVNKQIGLMQEKYRNYRKDMVEDDEKIKRAQAEIQALQVQVDILTDKPGPAAMAGGGGTNWNTAEDEELTAWLEKIAVSEEPVSPRREADREVEVSRSGFVLDAGTVLESSNDVEGLMDLASCHLDQLLPLADRQRLFHARSGSKAQDHERKSAMSEWSLTKG